jgi:hypothetical protein
MAIVINGTTGITQAGEFDSDSTMGFKNRIINGAMVIDQRNAGASVTPTNGAYTLDRWAAFTNGAGVYTVQQSSTAPSGFSNSILATVTTIDSSVTGTDYYMLQHKVEGFNSADFAWGSASAATVTLSFWVRSSITGTYSVKLGNSASDRFYVATYTINSANTWEQKTITLSGDTSGTWVTNSGTGIEIRFGLAIGSSFTTSTIAAWAAGNSFGATTASNNWISTNGATFYITGVQLEKGSTATSFDFRSIGQELALCQRYYEKSYNTDVVPGTNTQVGRINVWSGQSGSGRLYSSSFGFKVTKRATPTMSFWTYNGTSGQWHYGVYGASETAIAVTSDDNLGANGLSVYCNPGVSGQNVMYGHFAASAEL